MSYNNGAKIVTDNLAVCLDANNPSSYPGTGDIWYNLGSIGGSISKGTYLPQWTVLGGAKCFNFNQVGAYFQNDSFFPTQFPPDATNLTIDVWYYPAASELSAGDRGNLCRANNGNAWYMSWNKSSAVLSNYWYGKTSEGYHESGAAVSRSKWNNFVSVWTSAALYQYTNLVKTTATTSGATANKTGGLQIGWEADGRQLAGGIALIKIYDRALSDMDILKNYNAAKGRFGL